MTDSSTGGPRRGRANPTRRGFLALAGTAALTGCSAIEDFTEDEPPTIDGDDFADALAGDPPTAAETVPVAVETSYLDASADRAREFLSSVPAPFDSREIPNGAIRAELSRLYEDAGAALDDAQSAASAAETMARLRDARGSARGVAAAWAAVDEELARDDVLEAVPAIRDDVDAFRRRWRYVGDDPVRAALVHGRVEELVAYAFSVSGRARMRSRRESESPVTVGELAERVEDARAALDDAEQFYDSYAESLDPATEIRDGLVAAGEELAATLDDRRGDLPDADDPSSYVDRDVEGTPVATALADLDRAIDYAHGLDDERSTGRRASVVLSAHETLIRVGAFESLRERASNGDHVTVETADDVRTIREEAFEAVEEALESGEDLTRQFIAGIAGDFEYFEDQLGQYRDRDEVSAAWLNRDLGRYVLIEAMARETPATSTEVADVLREHV